MASVNCPLIFILACRPKHKTLQNSQRSTIEPLIGSSPQRSTAPPVTPLQCRAAPPVAPLQRSAAPPDQPLRPDQPLAPSCE
ncbi:hypothetical protein ACOSQ4_009092 [Xanthoceras sorbifolium]